MPLAASAAPVVPTGAARLGAPAAGTKMHVNVTLNVPDQAALTAFLNVSSDQLYIPVGVVEFERNLPRDITSYEQCYGINTKVN